MRPSGVVDSLVVVVGLWTFLANRTSAVSFGSTKAPVSVERAGVLRFLRAPPPNTAVPYPSPTSAVEPLALVREIRARIPVPYESCQTASRWTKLYTAEDIYDNPVVVLDALIQADAPVEQLFYERYCVPENLTVVEKSFRQAKNASESQEEKRPRCKGMSSGGDFGYCVTKYTYSYANVLNQRGQIGWTAIRIKGGCECAIFSKSHATGDVMEYLRQIT